MAMDYFRAYHSLRESLKPYGEAEIGRLFMAGLEYSETGAAPDLRGNERYIWPTFKQMIDRDKAAYAAKCEKNRANACERYRTHAFACESVRPELRKEEGEKEAAPQRDTPREKVSPRTPFLKENPPENPPPEESGEEEKTQSVRVRSAVEDAFDEFWKAYPKKVGKKDAFRAFQKVPAAERPLLVPAVEMQKQSRQWQAEGGRFIPNPSTWINQGRWLDEGLDPAIKGRGTSKTANEMYDFYDMLKEMVREEEAKNNDAC